MRVTGAALIGIATPDSVDYLPLQNYWIRVICARINYEIGKEVGYAFSDRTMALVEAAELAGFKDRNIVGALLARISSSKIPIEVKSPKIGNHEELLKRAISDFGDRKVWLLVDDIDSTYVDSEQQRAIISTFFSACRTVARDISNVHIRVTVRSDVWTSLRKNEDLDKVEQYITDISWTANELKSVLSKKIYSYIQRSKVSVPSVTEMDYKLNADTIIKFAFVERFPWGSGRVPPFRPIQIWSSGRPRWMSQLCRLAGQASAKRQTALISMQDFRSVLTVYTRYRLNDLYKEHAHQYPDLERLVETFSNGKARFSTAELFAIIVNRYTTPFGSANIPEIDGYKYSSPAQIAHFLYKIGFIAARREHKGHSEFAEFVRHDERPALLTDHRNFDDGMQWEIYPSYRDALGIISAGKSARENRHQRAREPDVKLPKVENIRHLRR